MTDKQITRRILQVGALFLIGNGVMGLIKPRWHSLLWRFGPQLTHAMTEELADHPKVARAIYLAETALGLTIASLPAPDAA